jgi:hypothetical protein
LVVSVDVHEDVVLAEVGGTLPKRRISPSGMVG